MASKLNEHLMDSEQLPFSYVVAEGPDGLRQQLDAFLLQAQNDPQFAAEQHYILYQLGQQKALIKVDMGETPFQFWYYDLLGRPITRPIKETISQFLWERCGERERYIKEVTERH